jgi:N-methylhydantoinase B
MPFDFFGTVDRVKYPARGCFGGQDGAPGHLQLASGQLIQGKGKQRIPAGEVLVFQTPGGGGYGDPCKRPVAEVVRDYAAGLISKAALRRDYGVLLKADGKVDGPATREQRRKRRSQ